MPTTYQLVSRISSINSSLFEFESIKSVLKKRGGGFKYVFILTPTWGNDPISGTCFKWVETTN